MSARSTRVMHTAKFFDLRYNPMVIIPLVPPGTSDSQLGEQLGVPVHDAFSRVPKGRWKKRPFFDNVNLYEMNFVVVYRSNDTPCGGEVRYTADAPDILLDIAASDSCAGKFGPELFNEKETLYFARTDNLFDFQAITRLLLSCSAGDPSVTVDKSRKLSLEALEQIELAKQATEAGFFYLDKGYQNAYMAFRSKLDLVELRHLIYDKTDGKMLTFLDTLMPAFKFTDERLYLNLEKSSEFSRITPLNAHV